MKSMFILPFSENCKMPRLKNSRRQTKRSKQRGKQKLVVAMVSKTSLRSQRKQSALKEAEKDDQSENEAKSLRPKRGKPVKRLIEEESPKIASNKRKATKKAASKGKKKPVRKIQPKATKRKGIKSEGDLKMMNVMFLKHHHYHHFRHHHHNHHNHHNHQHHHHHFQHCLHLTPCLCLLSN